MVLSQPFTAFKYSWRVTFHIYRIGESQNKTYILVTTKMEPKPAKSVKKEPSKKPIAQKEPSKLLKKEKPEATPTVQVAASTTLPPIESASKNTYLVVEGDTQKVIDYGDEVNYH